MSSHGVTPTCSWHCVVENGDDGGALEERVSVVSTSADGDGAMERRIAEISSGSGRQITLSGVPSNLPCEVVVPIPEGASVRAVAVVSGARTVELYAVRPSSYDRAYVKTVRASVLQSPKSPTAESPNCFECVAELGATPCVALVVRLFVSSNGAGTDQHAHIGLRGVVVELKDGRHLDVRRALAPSMDLQIETQNAPHATTSDETSEKVSLKTSETPLHQTHQTPPSVPMGSPLRLATLEAATRSAAGLPPPSGSAAGMSNASASMMLQMLRGMAGTRSSSRNGTERADAAKKLDASDDTVGSLEKKINRIESLLTRMERGVFAAFERIETRIETLETKVGLISVTKLGGEGRPPKAHTKREWDAGVRDDIG